MTILAQRNEVNATTRGIPENIGTPTGPRPVKCSQCATPIWRWNGQVWVCYNCKYHHIVYERGDGDLSTLDGCKATGVYSQTHKEKPVVARPPVTSPAKKEEQPTPPQNGPGDVRAVNGVLTDTHLYTLVGGKVTEQQLLAVPAHMGDIMQLCLDHNLQTIWIAAETRLSEAAAPEFVDVARGQWEFKSVRYSCCKKVKDASTGKKRDVPTRQSRCMFLSGWKKKESRVPGESGRMLYVGYAEHNDDWALTDVTRPETLLLAIIYIEDALGVPVLFSAGYAGRLLMEETNKKRRAEWVRPADIAAIEPALHNPLMCSGVSDIAWKRAFTDEERAMSYLVAYDKNSMYTSSCTSVLLGAGIPTYQTSPTFDCKKILPGIWHCTISGSSDFDGVRLPHPTDGVTCGWFWTYTVKLLHELGYHVEIDAAYVWEKEQAHTILRPFAEKAWAARSSLNDKYEPDTARYPDKAARAATVNALKLVQVKSLGWLDMTEKVKEEGKGYQGYRPDWYQLLKDNARYQMFWRIRSIREKTGRIPVGVHADCLYYTASTDDHEHAIARMMERWNPSTKQYEQAHTKSGGFKRKYVTTITVEQAASLFNDPTLQIGQINKQFLALDKATKKEQVQRNG